MKAVILDGGLGTRLAEETHLRPKPMVDIGGKPILWHIMKIYSSQIVVQFFIIGSSFYLVVLEADLFYNHCYVKKMFHFKIRLDPIVKFFVQTL